MRGSDNRKPGVVLASRRNADHAPGTGHGTNNGDSDAAPTGHGLAPTPDDLLIASNGSDLAWCTRRFLRDRGLRDDVNLSAAWRTLENPPRLADISVTVAVSETAETMSDALMAALEERVAARSLDDPLRVHLHCRRETHRMGAKGGTCDVHRP